MAHRCSKDPKFAAIFGDLCSRSADCLAIKNLCALFLSTDSHHRKSAEIALFHFCSEHQKNAELVEFLCFSLPSGREKYTELKQQFVGSYAVTAHAKIQCHRIRLAFVDDVLSTSPSPQRSSATPFCSCDIRGISVRIKRMVDERANPLSRASSPSSIRPSAVSPILSPMSPQPCFHQAICEVESFDFDALVRNAGNFSMQMKSSREEAHGIRLQADQLQLCTLGPINVGKLAASMQTLHLSASLQDVAAFCDPFFRIIESLQYAGSSVDQNVLAQETQSDSIQNEFGTTFQGNVSKSVDHTAQLIARIFRNFHNAEFKFDGLIFDLEICPLLEQVGAKILVQVYPMQVDSRSFLCHGVRVKIGRQHADMVLFHVLPMNYDHVGTHGSALSLQALQTAIYLEHTVSSISLELFDVFIGNDKFESLEDFKTILVFCAHIPEVIYAGLLPKDTELDHDDHCDPRNGPAHFLREKFVPFFIYDESFARPLAYSTTSALQKRVAARVFGNSAMVSPISGNPSPGTNFQDASAPTMDPISLRFFGDNTPSIAADDRSSFVSPAAFGARAPYALDEVSRISAGGGNYSAMPFYSVLEPPLEAGSRHSNLIRFSLGNLTLTIPGRDHVSTSCSLGVRFEVTCSYNESSQVKAEAALESLRIYRCRFRGDEHSIVHGVAVRVEVAIENPETHPLTPQRRMSVFLQRGLKICLGTQPLSSINQVGADLDHIQKLFAPDNLSNSARSCHGQSTPTFSPEMVSVFPELDAPPPIFGSPVRVRSENVHQHAVLIDDSISLFLNQQKFGQPDPSNFHFLSATFH